MCSCENHYRGFLSPRNNNHAGNFTLAPFLSCSSFTVISCTLRSWACVSCFISGTSVSPLWLLSLYKHISPVSHCVPCVCVQNRLSVQPLTSISCIFPVCFAPACLVLPVFWPDFGVVDYAMPYSDLSVCVWPDILVLTLALALWIGLNCIKIHIFYWTSPPAMSAFESITVFFMFPAPLCHFFQMILENHNFLRDA